MLAKFPPTLVLSSSRDALLGNALDTYARLVDAKVESQLYVRECFGHGYFTQAPEIPEAIAAWRVTVDFFDRHLFRAKYSGQIRSAEHTSELQSLIRLTNAA